MGADSKRVLSMNAQRDFMDLIMLKNSPNVTLSWSQMMMMVCSMNYNVDGREWT